MPAQELRDYQAEAIRANKLAWERQNSKGRAIQALNSLATGGGKTTIFSQLIRETIEPGKQRALAFVHRREIVHQIKERITNQFEELEPVYRVGNTLVPGIGIVMGSQDEPDSRVVVSTVQSLRPERLRRVMQTGAFDLVIFDEAHHLAADNTNHQLIETLFEANPAMWLAGFTATPKRTDKKALAVGFDEIVFEWTILDGIMGGYLVPATRLQVKSGIDLSGLPIVGGDYNHKKMLSVLEAANWLDLTFEAYQTYLQGKRHHIMAFMPSVQMSKQFVAHLQAMNVKAAHIGDDTPLQVRDEILRTYKRGELEVLSNFSVLTEGVDVPMTDAIIHARPTRSDTVLTQMVGRGLRLHPGKTDCLVLDLTVKDVKAMQGGTLLGKLRQCHRCNAEFYVGFQFCPNCGAQVPDSEKRDKPQDGDPIIVNTKYKIMRGLEADVVPLLDKLAGAWYRHSDEFMSVGAGDGAMVIAPPSYADMTRQRERLERGDYLLTRIDDEDRPDLIAQMAILQRQVDRAEKYSLYYVIERRHEYTDEYGETRYKVIGTQVNYLRSNADLASLIAEADLEALRRTPKDKQSLFKRDSGWRNDLVLASDKQINFLRRLAKGEGFPEPLTKDQASNLITHYKFVPHVKAHIAQDVLPEPEQEAA